MNETMQQRPDDKEGGQATYYAKEGKLLWLLLFVVTLTYAYAWESHYSYLAYVLLFFFVAAMTTNYRLHLSDDVLRYEIRLLGLTVKQRIIQAGQIEKLHFIHLGERTIVLIYVKKGLRLRLHRFQPSDFSEHLRTFAAEHQLPVEVDGKR